MDKYKEHAPGLAIAAARKAVTDWGGDKKRITHVVAVTCTGQITIDIFCLFVYLFKGIDFVCIVIRLVKY